MKSFYYLTRAVSSPTSDLGKAILPASCLRPASCLLGYFVRVWTEDLASVVLYRVGPVTWSLQLFSDRGSVNSLPNKHDHEYAESDNCRLQVCSFQGLFFAVTCAICTVGSYASLSQCMRKRFGLCQTFGLFCHFDI